MKNKSKNYNLFIGLGVLLMIIFLIALVGYFLSRPKPMVLQGEAEASEYRVSGKVPGRIEKLYVKEGQVVCKGDTLAYIESPEVQAKLQQVEALRDAAVAQRNKAMNGARQEQIAGAYELWQTALVQEDVMQKSYLRMKNRLGASTYKILQQETVKRQTAKRKIPYLYEECNETTSIQP